MKSGTISNFLGVLRALVLHPGRFFEDLSQRKIHTSSLVFLLFCSAFASIMAILFIPQKKAIFLVIFLLNGMLMAFVTAFILYLVTFFLCKDVFTYQSLFRITAYAQVTLLAAWVPGLSWPVGIWKFYLIGLGMVKVGTISAMKAFVSLLIMGGMFILLIQLSQPLLSNVK
ncbi:MAG: YIP1 family protein [Deltaproteobacteria bacterium]|nr:MAG: YIP1 family protein [Deltaproteobacteria bacterium]